MALASCSILAAASASAGGMNLSWIDCGLAGNQNQSFLCNTNSGPPFAMYASFDPPVDLPKLVGGLAVIDIESPSQMLPSWWHFKNPGTCRENSMSVNTNFAFGPLTCTDPWAGSASGTFAYTIGQEGSNTARLDVSFGVPEALAATVLAGTEYYAFSIVIDRAKTVGTGVCADCLIPSCIVLDRMRLYQSTGLGDYCINSPLIRNFITWQGGVMVSPGCPFADRPLGDCTTPTLRNTWGQIKSLYR